MACSSMEQSLPQEYHKTKILSSDGNTSKLPGFNFLSTPVACESLACMGCWTTEAPHRLEVPLEFAWKARGRPVWAPRHIGSDTAVNVLSTGRGFHEGSACHWQKCRLAGYKLSTNQIARGSIPELRLHHAQASFSRSLSRISIAQPHWSRA